MAQPVEFSEQNDVLAPYPGTEQWVQPLPIFRQGLSFAAEGQRFDPCVVSCWELTPEEVAEVQRTGRLYFQCFGTTHPPISVHGISPFVPLPAES